MTVEHEFPANFLASAQYIGSRGVRLFSRGAVNLCNSPVTPNILPGNPSTTPPTAPAPWTRITSRPKWSAGHRHIPIWFGRLQERYWVQHL